jgi:hypothetical protein
MSSFSAMLKMAIVRSEHLQPTGIYLNMDALTNNTKGFPVEGN